MSTAIWFHQVSKKFTLQHQRPRSFQDLLIQLFRQDDGPPHGRAKASQNARGGRREEFWALRDVNFTIDDGETVGIIGPNGAGKSTVLKLASRIIEPTSGEIEVNGRLGALLELGAGFHPDLSGRENVYLNGSILGLSRREIDKRLDAIIAFSEMGRFIDMPVRHYSSGMYVRLGFSVAVHTDPEVLLIDEVLAVGDAGFQRKCLEKISELRQKEVTIVFISHNADTVRSLCSRAIWLDEGQIVADGSTESVVAQYLDRAWSKEGARADLEPDGERRWGNGKLRITQVRLLGLHGEEKRQFQVGEPLVVEMHYQAEEKVNNPVFGLAIHRRDGLHVTGPNTRFARDQIPAVDGKGVVRYRVESVPLLEGSYRLSVAAHDWAGKEMYDYHDRLYRFRVSHTEGERHGVVTLGGAWTWKA